MLQRLHTRGQALVEFALTATLIFFLLAATVDLGLIFFTLQGLHNAAQEGATYGSRWLKTDPNTGVSDIDYYTIRDHVRHEAGDRSSGFANLFDLNSNGIDDMAEDGANLGAVSGSSLFPTYIQIRALQDVDGNGDPLNDNTSCPSVANKALSCFLQVQVAADYNFLFPLAPAFGGHIRLTSSYVIPMRSGTSQGGAPTASPVIVTVTPAPTSTPVPTNTPAPTPTTCPALGGPSLSGSQSLGNVSLSWSAVSGATSYQVYRSITATGSFSLLTTVAGTSTTDTINKNKTYRYYVVAVNSCGTPGTAGNTVSVIRGNT